MTVQDTSRIAGPYAGNDSRVNFTFTFKVFATSDVWVILTVDDVEGTQTIVTHYDVALNADQDANPGGTVTMVTAPATGEDLTVTGDMPAEQGSVLPTAGNWSPKIVENALDKLNILLQETKNLAERCLYIPISDTGVDMKLPALADRLGNFMQFNVITGAPDMVASVTGASVSPFMETLLDDTDAETARRTLNADHEVLTPVRNMSGAQLDAGTPVYATGYNSGQDRVTIAKADANDTAKMPCIGITHVDLANSANGYAVAMGIVENLDTSAFSVGDELYVSTTVGTLTVTRPTGAAEEVQSIAIVLRSHATLGRLLVDGPGRPNDVPNGFVDTIPVVKGSSDGTKLVRIEADAIATGTTRVINMPDVDVTLATPTELTKLSGIETAADVTDAANVAAAGGVLDTGNESIGGVKTFTSDPLIPDEAYDATNWNGKLEPPTKNAVRDKIEALESILKAVKTSDEDVTSSTALQDDDELLVTVEANGVYHFEAVIIAYSASATPDLKFQFIEPDGTFDVVVTSGLGGDLISYIDESSSASVVDITAATEKVKYFTGIVRAGGAGGTFKLQWAQNVSNATATTVKADSYMRLTKMN